MITWWGGGKERGLTALKISGKEKDLRVKWMNYAVLNKNIHSKIINIAIVVLRHLLELEWAQVWLASQKEAKEQ